MFGARIANRPERFPDLRQERERGRLELVDEQGTRQASSGRDGRSQLLELFPQPGAATGQVEAVCLGVDLAGGEPVWLTDNYEGVRRKRPMLFDPLPRAGAEDQ